MTIDMSQFYQVFFEETAEHLASMESLLLGLNIDTPNLDDLNAIFRAAHSIKGGSGTFGFNDMIEATHVLETLLDKLRKDELKPTSEMIDVFLQAGDVLKSQLDGHQNGAFVDQDKVKAVCEKLKILAQNQGASHQATPALSVDPLPAPVEEQHISKPPQDDSYGFFVDIDTIKKESGDDAGYGFFGTDSTEYVPQNIPENTSSLPAMPGASHGSTPSNNVKNIKSGNRTTATSNADTSSIRVSTEKVDQLINLVGELVITQAMLSQTASQVDPVVYEKLLNGMTQLQRNTRDLQESVMSIRMMPISFVFSRFPRLVRDLAAKLEKQVELKTLGEGTELDKGLIEKISDPLTHLVRNSLDHGIEHPEKRAATGKDRKGTITLSASHQGGNIVISITDDGAGLNRDRILAKAREKGISVNDDMPDQDVWKLIFAPGFSTAEVVTDVSGRGVGMDVVKRNIEGMGGRVEISSVEGNGTTITIRLPLTLAILDGMSIAVGKEIFIIPLTYIVESMQPRKEDINTISGQGSVVHVRGEYLPLIALYEVFNLQPTVREHHQGILVILESDRRKIALFVDELVGQHQVVIKSLESNYKKVPGTAGATIMGDGKVAMIIDVASLVRMSHQQAA